MNDSKEHILKIAFHLFLKKSFKEVTMKEIVDETGMSKGAFYYHFSSKEKLFMEVIEKLYFEQFKINYSELVNLTLYEFYHNYVKGLNTKILKFKEIYNISDTGLNINYFSLIFDAIKIFPALKSLVIDALDMELKAWTKVIKRAKETGEIKSLITDEQIAKIFIYISDGMGMHLIIEGSLENSPKQILKLWDKFYEELKA